MKYLISEWAREVTLRDEYVENLLWILAQEKNQVYETEAQFIANRLYYAATKIQGVIRIFLARKRRRERSAIDRATRMIQRVARGRLGRRRWMREYWRSLSIVKSDEALQDLIERSTLIRTKERVGVKGYQWHEYFDPQTESYWYYNKLTNLNTWNCPLEFQQDLVCFWEAFVEHGGLPSQKKCRCVFDNVREYQEHLRNAHKWYCPACEHRNSGLVFPKCSLCGNTTSDNGNDAMKTLKYALTKVKKQINVFLKKDEADKVGDLYNIRERMLARANSIFKQPPSAAAAAGAVALTEGSSTSLPPIHNRSKSTDNLAAKRPAKSSVLSQSTIVGGSVGVSASVSLALPSSLVPPPPSSSREDYEGAMRLEIPRRGSAHGGDKQKESGEREVMHLGKWITAITPQIFDLLTDPKFDLSESYEYSAIHSGSNEGDEPSQVTGSQTNSRVIKSKKSSNIKFNLGADGLLVCEHFMHGNCKRSYCALAHPGKRDSSKLYTRTLSNGDTYIFVKICRDFIKNKCENGEGCECYHIQLRPASLRIRTQFHYDEEENVHHKIFKSGVELKGRFSKTEFTGYGIMTWPDGSTYIGDWINERREGSGIFRASDGSEYIGQWKNGMRHGLGMLITSNGDEYYGEWVEGKMEGVGRILGVNGDSYEGMFSNSKYHGAGKFVKKNGDAFMGQVENGVAQGLGVLTLFTGEKYKGSFDRNFRHGKGMCVFPDGSKFSGNWYRDHPDGLGVYLTKFGEKYIGQWSGGKKQGTGRFYFENGDFYDGEFYRDKAKGAGMYVAKSGSVYKGQWLDDRRHGFGTLTVPLAFQYSGFWENNMMNGKGKIQYMSGSMYRGLFKDNRRHGKGIFHWYSGNEYRGDFSNDEMSGFGELKYHNGNRYVGAWKNNKKNGKGTFFYASGAQFEGDWVDNVRQGRGKIVFLPGTLAEESYEGHWHQDQRHGKGKYIYRKDQGTIYEGDWVNGIREGKGLLTFKDGSYYRGDFHLEQMWGKGTYVGKDGTQYEGDWRKNMRQGVGTMLHADGTIYQGEFWGNHKHGHGKLYYPDGGCYEGQWEEDTIIGKGKFKMTLSNSHKEISINVFGF